MQIIKALYNWHDGFHRQMLFILANEVCFVQAYAVKLLHYNRLMTTVYTSIYRQELYTVFR